jgi:putative ABC transport system permease protein
MAGVGSDVRYTLRLLGKQPATATAILLTLAVGIGANTAVFSVVHAVLIRPLPYPQPDQLVMVWEQRPAEGNYANSVSPADFLDWASMSRSFAAMAAYTDGPVDLTGAGDPVQVPLASVTARFFEVLGVTPASGRTFNPDEDTSSQHRVVVISHRLWQQRFGGDAGMVGRSIVANGIPHQVVGILRADFEFPGEPVDIWAPLVLRGGPNAPPRALHNLDVYARLRPGVSLERAQAEMKAIGDELSSTYRENAGHGPRVVSLRENIVAPARQGLLLVMSAVAFLLLIACTNVANLLLASSAGRRHELAIRAAIGAARARLLRQSLTESGLLSLCGGVLGIFVAWVTLRLLIVETPPALRGVGLDRARLDLPVLAFTALASCVATVLAGLLPAWQVARTEPADPLRAGGGRSPLTLRRAVRVTLIGGQVALTVMLLIAAGLLTRTFVRVLAQPAGIETAGRLTVNLTLPRARYPDRDALRRARRAIDERFATMPGVVAFGANNNLPLTGSDSRQGITVEGFQRVPGDAPVRAHMRIVSSGYFAAAGIKLRDGRTFESSDDERAPLVVVINDTMARRYWPGQSPLGRRVRFNNEQEPWREVIGVIEDVKHWGLDAEVNPELYMPHDQQPSATLSYVLHVSGDPLAIVPAVDAHVKAFDPNLPLGSVRTFDDVAARSTAQRRWSALMLGVFAVIGIVLAAAGIYGVMSHLVVLRTGEIGIRLSLGAKPATVLRQVLGEAVINTGAGITVGLMGGLVAARLLKALLYQVEPYDLGTFAGAVAVVLVMAVCAALLPALGAMRTDPVQALRQG